MLERNSSKKRAALCNMSARIGHVHTVNVCIVHSANSPVYKAYRAGSHKDFPTYTENG